MTNETQTIDADALRARLAEMAQRAREEMAPADLRGRIEAALRARHGVDASVHLGSAPDGFRGRDAVVFVMGGYVAVRADDDGAALRGLASFVGLNADGSDPRAEIERLRALLAVTRASLEAASSGRRVTACEDIERLQRERDAALAVVAGLREEISDTADTLHRLSLAQQRLASQGSEEARAMGDAYLRAAQIVATIGDPARAAEVSK